MDLSKLVGTLLFCVTIIGVVTEATYAQEDPTKFPTRPITFIVPFSAGDVKLLSGGRTRGWTEDVWAKAHPRAS